MDLFETLSNAFIPDDSKKLLLDSAVEFFVNDYDNTIVATVFKPDCNLSIYFESTLWMQEEWEDWDRSECWENWYDDKSFLRHYMEEHLDEVTIHKS